MEDEVITFTTVNDIGEEVECRIISLFYCDETGKRYIIYTDNTYDEDGGLRVHAAIYKDNGEATELVPIETDREWEIIEEELNGTEEEE